MSERQHTLSTYMIGKVDRAGRLIPGEVRWAAYPDALFWQNKLRDLKVSLIFQLGGDAYDTWVADEIEESDTYQSACRKMQNKLNEVRSERI